MSLKLYAHPFSSYCQKALIALYENGTPFEFRLLAHDDPRIMAEFAELWPIRRFPVLVDSGRTVMEASIIIEYPGLNYPGPVALVPADARAALDVRGMDRFFDNYISTPAQKIVTDRLRPEAERDTRGVAEARAMLDTAYAWLDKTMVDREWAAAGTFSLADCAAAPALFYADWTHAIDPKFTQVRACRERLLARPSFARAVDEARPYRPLFPLGAPERD
ncbi:MAG: Maleylacetoacetate isomerase (EC @ Glutathione S-transferase [uncultured Paraburkholderia sp.]|nr:MAG: Maleylacetoacetate isomerase (EC @ Glutathione S-transferase [uncultured Paraburkholderia sp.]CAH2780440.1 MAG: Maleylacetoacetate isomerase (EC @ Glutathione S-transferase [uncultured Paraburkholderia sp.]CAH2912610.1 MAG: Maleylacetoacetate isomerase (EC @ Glutathione S-transferase [uncultured Paraburkholderia sp.]CAH2915571.1 MAG: Maleylacetoacetate isomerase (EC @ Glutathione S-transferase [uncultured Paraburkholderia sp.]